MGDNRQATRAPGPAPDAKKKDAGADAGGGGAVPEGAGAEPGAALIALGAQHASTLLGMLQSAGGNAEVNELQSLETGKQLAAQAKADKENVDNMTDGQKLEKFGGKGEGSGKAPPPEGTPPDGVPGPAQVLGFHQSRAGQLGQLASQHKTVSGQLAGAGAAEGLAPQMAGFLGQAGAQSATQAMSLGQLAQSYIQTSKELGKSEFVGAAMPGPSIQTDYQARAAGIQSQVTALDMMTAEYTGALAAEQARMTAIDAEIAGLQKQIAEAQAMKGAKGKEGGGGGPAPGLIGGAMAKAPAMAPSMLFNTKQAGKGTDPGKSGESGGPTHSRAPLPAFAKIAAKGETKGADSKAEAKKDTKGADAKPAPAPAPGGAGAKGSSGATAKTPAPVVAPAPTPAPKAPAPPPSAPAPTSDAGADPVPGMMAQIQRLQQQKQAIEMAIRSNQGLVSTMKAYREQMNALLSAYQTVLGITPPQG